MSRFQDVGFALFLLPLLLAGIFFGLFPAFFFVLGGSLALFLCWRRPFQMATAAIAAGPLIGWLVSIPLPRTAYGDRLFGGSIDLPVSDVFAFAGLFALGVWFLRTGAWRDSWRRLPFLGSYAALVGAHVASLFSTAGPDRLAVLKYALRPVAFSYAAFVAVPVLALRRWQDVRRSFGLFLFGATLFAAQGLVSLFVGVQWTVVSLQRARPLPVFGAYPIGMNHNVLAEWLVVAAPFGLALAAWTHERRLRKPILAAAGFCTFVALLTFARSAWIVLGVELICAFATVWRAEARAVWGWVRRGAWLLALPLAGYMAWFSLRAQVSSSTDARAMLTGIAWDAFLAHPLVGIGAGTFFSRVDGTWGYHLLFGGAMDAHGVFQKLLAETGIAGTAAYLLVTVVVARLMWRVLARLGWRHRIGEGLVFAAIGVIGAWTYQIFNTTYWSAKLWLPIGLFFAAANLCHRRKSYV